MKFDWDHHNIAHIAEHHVTPLEAEEALRGFLVDLDSEIVNGERRLTQLGETKQRHILLLVSVDRGEAVRVVTAFPPGKGYERVFLAEKAQAYGIESGTSEVR